MNVSLPTLSPADVWNGIYQNGYVYGTQPSEALKQAMTELSRRDLIERHSCFLELGCGYGRDLVAASQSINRVIGVDISPQAINLGREFVSKANRSQRTIDLLTSAAHDYLQSTKLEANGRMVLYTHYFLQVLNKIERARLLSILEDVSPVGTIFIFSEYSRSDHRFGQGEEVEHGSYRLYADRPEHVIHFFVRDEMAQIATDLRSDVLLMEEYAEPEMVEGRSIDSTSWLCVLRKAGEENV